MQLPRLSRYVNDGRFCTDKNLVENAIRPLALGRKNVLFYWDHDAAIRAAIVYSLVDRSKTLEVDPREWMEDILLRITFLKLAYSAMYWGIITALYSRSQLLSLHRHSLILPHR